MIPRRRGERTQKGNPHRLTREQHVIPAATLRRFALPDGRVEVHLRDGRIVKLPVGDRLFCVERLWDQRSEVGYMKRIEDEYQALVTDLEAGHPGPLTNAEHRCVTRFWGLWHWRNHFIDTPLEDVKLNSVAGESMSLDKREILESNGYAFAVGDGKMPARMMTGLHIQIAIDRHEMANGGRRWGILRSPALPLVIADRPGDLLQLPASPHILLAADNQDGYLPYSEAFRANRAAFAFSRNFAVIGRF